jgi:hypothetical protein
LAGVIESSRLFEATEGEAGLDPNRWENGSAATVIQPMDFDGPSHGAGNWSALVGVKKRRPFRGDAVQLKF